MVRGTSPEWSTLYFRSSSGNILAEFNFSTTYLVVNTTQQAVTFGFRLWHVQGVNIERVNLTFDVAPWPADVWVSQFNYDTGGYAPLHVEDTNFSGGPTGVSGGVLTLSAFPPENPTTVYGVGLAYKNAELPADVGSTSVSVEVVLASGSGLPFVGNTYVGRFGFNLVYVAYSPIDSSGGYPTRPISLVQLLFPQRFQAFYELSAPSICKCLWLTSG